MSNENKTTDERIDELATQTREQGKLIRGIWDVFRLYTFAVMFLGFWVLLNPINEVLTDSIFWWNRLSEVMRASIVGGLFALLATLLILSPKILGWYRKRSDKYWEKV